MDYPCTPHQSSSAQRLLVGWIIANQGSGYDFHHCRDESGSRGALSGSTVLPWALTSCNIVPNIGPSLDISRLVTANGPRRIVIAKETSLIDFRSQAMKNKQLWNL